jgi:hypothetical protein
MHKSRPFFLFFFAALLLGFLFFILTKSNLPFTQTDHDQIIEYSNQAHTEIEKPLDLKKESEKNFFINSDPSSAKKNHRPHRVPSALHLIIAPEDLMSDEILNETPWKIWSHVESVVKADYAPSQVILSEITNRYIIQSNDENANLSEFKKSKLTVLYNSRLKKAGLLSGQIKIVTNRKDLLEQKLKSLNASIVNSFETIQTYFVTSLDESFDLRFLFLNLKEQPFTNSIELDVIDRTYEKK